MENTLVLRKKTMIVYRKLWNFDLLLKNYGTMEKNYS